MGNGLIFQLDVVDKFNLSVRNFFGPIVKFLYYLIANAIDLMFELANKDFGFNDVLEDLSKSIFAILVIFMIFKLTLSLLNYLINPDSFLDKSTGFPKLIVRIIVSIILLISINPIFDLLFTIQKKLLVGEGSSVIDSIILSKEETKYINRNGTKERVFVIDHMDEKCPGNYHIYAYTRGDAFSIQALKPFYTLNDPAKMKNVSDHLQEVIDAGAGGYCGIDLTDDTKNGKIGQTGTEKLDASVHTASDLLSMDIYSNVVTEKEAWDYVKDYIKNTATNVGSLNGLGIGKYIYDVITDIGRYEKAYVVDFSYVWAMIFGTIILLLLITYSFDVVIRAFTLFLYQLVAPIPIILNMSPNKKDSDALMNWVKKTATCWASLFIRIAILDFFLLMIDIILNKSKVLDLKGNHLIAQLFIILGGLMFAKKLPKLLEEIIPGLKLDDLKLNPFKRVKEDALGGSVATGAVSATTGMAVDSVVQAGTNAIAFGRERNLLKKQISEAHDKGDTAKEKKLQHRLDRMNARRFVQTTSGGFFGGARRGIVSGYKTGASGSGNVFKNVRKDVKDANIARNTRTAIRTFNNDLKDETRDKIAKAQADLASGAITTPEYLKTVADAKQDEKDQRYTWFDRNVIERLDREAGVKNTTGGYGFYEDKIEKLNQKIENKHQQEITLRQSVTNKITTDSSVKMDARMFEELRNEMAEKKLKFDDVSKYYDVGTMKYKDSDFERIVKDIQSKYGIAALDVMNDYNKYRTDLGAITGLDNDQKDLKAERKTYSEMMEARKDAQGK